MSTKTKAKTSRQTKRPAAKERRAAGDRRSASFSRREAALLADVSLRSVDKAIEERVVKPRRSARRSPLLDSGDVLAIAMIARAGLPLSNQTKQKINQWVHGIASEDTASDVAELLLSDIVVLRFDDGARALAERLSEYLEGRERFINSDPEVMGGDPVITGTRIPVRALAARIDAGESIDDLREDYPQVSRDAFEAALTYARAHPRRGRPARPWRDA